jgi:hypothetical protein
MSEVMYANYLTGYSYGDISISGRPDRVRGGGLIRRSADERRRYPCFLIFSSSSSSSSSSSCQVYTLFIFSGIFVVMILFVLIVCKVIKLYNIPVRVALH